MVYCAYTTYAPLQLAQSMAAHKNANIPLLSNATPVCLVIQFQVFVVTLGELSELYSCMIIGGYFAIAL